MNNYNFIHLCNVDSTNNYILNLKGSNKFKEGLIVTTDFQTNGKGQRGNSWESEKGKNLIFSILIEADIVVEKQFDLSKIISVSLIDCLCFFGLKSSIKWPNDILVEKKKIAGILIQNIISKNGVITHSVIGIGLNVNQRIFNDYHPKATSLSIELKKNFVLKEIKLKLLKSLQNNIEMYRKGANFDLKYIDTLYMKGKVSVFESDSIRFNGIIRGVKDNGRLIVETSESVKKFAINEIKMLF